MIPSSIRNMFNDPQITFAGIQEDRRDFLAIFNDQAGKEWLMRRETVLTPTKNITDYIKQANTALGHMTRMGFTRQLLNNDTAKMLHAEMLGPDIARLTFHPYGTTPLKGAFGYILNLYEIDTIAHTHLDELDKIRQNMPIKSCVPAAISHNLDLLECLAAQEIRIPNQSMARYISNKFE